jgi:acyl-coenzyme A synthetase/AMP-(fatty) acid ligase/thioesterase domain-containing protein/acyl carrier protein
MRLVTAIFRSERAESNGFNARDGFRPFELQDAEATLGQRFRETALRREDAIAVVDGDTRVSYWELLQRAEAIASNLRSRCGENGGVVGICLPSSLATIETMLGALLGGFAYFCLDPSLPAEQKIQLLKAAAPVALEDGGMNLGDISGFKSSVETLSPAGVAALYATSGSTGEPKMVALSNRAILFDIGRQTNDLYLGADDHFDSQFSFAFSASLATTFGALLNGGELHCYDPRHNMTGLPGWLAERRITVSTMTVSMLRHLCLLGPFTGLQIRLLSVGGEALHTADVEAFRDIFPASCVLQNAMASTETRTYAQYFVPRTGPVESPVPIGWPVAGKDVQLIDEDGAPVGLGGQGEIVVSSAYLADGYSNDAKRTAIKFQQQSNGVVVYRTGDRGSFRPDGSLVFLGRTDSQAKIRGHRVELDYIAQTIELHPLIRTSVVITWADSAGNDRLVAYVVTHVDSVVSHTDLRKFLRERLPGYSVPSIIVFLADLPLNSNFKVDRRSLPPPPDTIFENDALISDEKIGIVRDIWKSVLHCSEIDDDETFADLGGDSLSAVRVLVAINERFGCNLPPDRLHRFPTVRLMTDCVDTEVRGETTTDGVMVFKVGGSGCPFFFVAGLGGSAFGYRHVAEQIDSCHPAYGLSSRSGFAVLQGVSVESMAADHVSEIERIVPRGQTVVLVGHSFGGTIAFEIAVQLRKRGILTPLPIIIDMPAVNARGLQRRTRRQRLLDVLRNLPTWTWQEATHFHLDQCILRASGALSHVFCRLRLKPADDELDPRVYFGKSNLPGAYQAFLNSMYKAMLAYVPKDYGGRVVLLRAKVPTLSRSSDRTMGWHAVAQGGVEVRAIPGSHSDCLSARHGAKLASVLIQFGSAFEAAERELV